MNFWRRLRPPEEEEAPPPIVRKPRPTSTLSLAASSYQENPFEGHVSHLGSGLRWKGQLTGKGRVHIRGSFEGVIQVQGEVIVEEQGRVQVEQLEALTLVVAGVVQGPVKARHVILRRTGRLYGDVLTTTLEAESGGFLRGQVRMEERLDFPWEKIKPEADPTPVPPERPASPETSTTNTASQSNAGQA